MEGDAAANGISVEYRDVSDYKGHCVHFYEYDEGNTSQLVARQLVNESLIVKH